MRCAWDSLLGILPRRMREEIDRLGRDNLLELRLRRGAPPELSMKADSVWLDTVCSQADIAFVIQSASHYSPWTMESIKQGYLTAPGGHRIGLCGLSLYRNGTVTAIREITSLCIRVARDFPGIAVGAPMTGSVLVLGAPGWGKTTLLRDLVRQRSGFQSVAVVDERGELFPEGFDTGRRTDILRGSRKREGIEQVLRTMGPSCIALDEVTAEEDCDGLTRAAGCGVDILATAHAGSMEEFILRPAYRALMEKQIFQSVLVMTRDKCYRVERATV